MQIAGKLVGEKSQTPEKYERVRKREKKATKKEQEKE